MLIQADYCSGCGGQDLELHRTEVGRTLYLLLLPPISWCSNGDHIELSCNGLTVACKDPFDVMMRYTRARVSKRVSIWTTLDPRLCIAISNGTFPADEIVLVLPHLPEDSANVLPSRHRAWMKKVTASALSLLRGSDGKLVHPKITYSTI